MIENMQNEHPPTDRRKLSLLKVALYAGFAVGAIVLICALALLLFSDPLVNRFIKPRITKAFAEVYPAYSIRIADMNYNVLKNKFGFDSVALRAVDGTFSNQMGQFSVGGIHWLHLLWGGSLAPNDFANSIVEAQDIMLNLTKSRYKFLCKRLRVSVPDSEIVAESLKVHPLVDDDEFFRESNFRRTRLSIVTPQISVMGLACLDLLQGKSYRARSVHIHDALLDILVNKFKPDSRDTAGPFMPNEILASIKETLQVDSLSFMNGWLKYGEGFVLGAKPAFVTFDNMQVLAEGIANHGGRDAVLVIHAQAKFVNAGTMKVLMRIPVASPEFSFHYSGSLSKMELSPLNSMLEISDQMRIKSGVLQEATFDVNVVSGRASGTLRGVYNDLKLAAINRQTGSEKGFSNGIKTFIANKFKILKTNVPDKSGSMKIGQVKYTRQPDDPFIQFAWFALRIAVRDVVGF
ncbi:MAG: hypothetical protein ABR936_07440 [Bacteroidota bacterium]